MWVISRTGRGLRLKVQSGWELRTNGLLSLVASLLSKSKQTATYIWRYEMRVAISQGLSSVKYPRSLSGARFATRFQSDPDGGFRFTFTPTRKLTLTKLPSSP
jgi:hypothetical protein